MVRMMHFTSTYVVVLRYSSSGHAKYAVRNSSDEVISADMYSFILRRGVFLSQQCYISYGPAFTSDHMYVKPVARALFNDPASRRIGTPSQPS